MGVRANLKSDIPEPYAAFHDLKRLKKALFGHFDKLPFGRADLSDTKGSCSVTVISVNCCAKINGHNLTFFNKPVFGRKTMHDFFVDGNATAGGETVIVQKSWDARRI